MSFITRNTKIQARSTDYLYLILAALLSLFGFGHWTVAAATWLGPIFLLRFLRLRREKRAFLLAWIVMSVAGYLAIRGFVPIPAPFDFAFTFLMGLTPMLPYLVERWLAPRLDGFLSTLVLPAAAVSLSYLSSLPSPFGSWGNVAYSQAGSAALFQLASFAGMWGVIFLIYWTAAVVVWAWEQEFSWGQIRREIAFFAAVVAMAFIAGGVRQATAPPATETVRVATVIPSTEQLYASLPDDVLVQKLLSGEALSAGDAQTLRAAMAPLHDDLFRHSAREARAGAELILWPEGAAWVLASDEPDLLARGRALAQAEGVYLAMGLTTFHDDGSLHENKLVLLDPAGEAVLTYHKTMLVPFVEEGVFVAGDGTIPVVETPFGRVGAVICYDMDDHEFIAQLAGQEVDLLLVPVGDWAEIGRTHLDMSRLRAVEQGMTVVRAARGGISAVISPRGEVLASLNRADVHVDGTLVEPPLPASTAVMVAEAPAQSGITTLYSRLGDAFAWGNLLGLAALVVLAFVRRRVGVGDTVASEPSPV